MKVNQDKQVKANLYPYEYRVLDRVRRRLGFRSDYEYVRSIVVLISKLLDTEGVDEARDMQAQARQYFSDLLERYLIDTTPVHGVYTPLFGEELTEGATPREWVNRFISIYYERLFYEFSTREQTPREDDGFTPIDIFEDTILRLYTKKTEHQSYEAWEAWALAKFKCPLAIKEAQAKGGGTSSRRKGGAIL